MSHGRSSVQPRPSHALTGSRGPHWRMCSHCSLPAPVPAGADCCDRRRRRLTGHWRLTRVLRPPPPLATGPAARARSIAGLAGPDSAPPLCTRRVFTTRARGRRDHGSGESTSAALRVGCHSQRDSGWSVIARGSTGVGGFWVRVYFQSISRQF